MTVATSEAESTITKTSSARPKVDVPNYEDATDAQTWRWLDCDGIFPARYINIPARRELLHNKPRTQIRHYWSVHLPYLWLDCSLSTARRRLFQAPLCRTAVGISQMISISMWRRSSVQAIAGREFSPPPPRSFVWERSVTARNSRL